MNMPEQGLKIDYDHLIQTDKVHSSLYTSQQVFEDEIDTIFHHGWVFVGHDSEIPNPGDYVLRRLGRQPVVMIRDKDGQVNVIRNRCSHRANMVCGYEGDNKKVLVCPYHGWVFDLNGDLLDVPDADGYPDDFDKSQYGMAPATQMEVYRGFVFACLEGCDITLAEHLGKATELIDRAVDLSPEGELDLQAGWLKHKFQANWKMLPENDCDGYHVGSTHSSFVQATDTQVLDLLDENAEVVPVVRDWGNGHMEIDFNVAYKARNNPFEWFGNMPASKLQNYTAALIKNYGEERAHELTVTGPPHAIIFPNLFLGELNVVFYYPTGPDECVQLYTPMTLKGAPEINRRALHQTEGAVGPASFLIPEDVIIAERNQSGLQAGGQEWVDLSRGLHREYEEDGKIVSHMSDETVNRGFWRRYKKEMNNANR